MSARTHELQLTAAIRATNIYSMIRYRHCAGRLLPELVVPHEEYDRISSGPDPTYKLQLTTEYHGLIL